MDIPQKSLDELEDEMSSISGELSLLEEDKGKGEFSKAEEELADEKDKVY